MTQAHQQKGEEEVRRHIGEEVEVEEEEAEEEDIKEQRGQIQLTQIAI